MTSIQSLSSHGSGDRKKLTFLYKECNRCNYWWSLFFLISLPCSECYRSCLGFLLGQVQAPHLRDQHDTHLSSVSVEINITFSSLLESRITQYRNSTFTYRAVLIATKITTVCCSHFLFDPDTILILVAFTFCQDSFLRAYRDIVLLLTGIQISHLCITSLTQLTPETRGTFVYTEPLTFRGGLKCVR